MEPATGDFLGLRVLWPEGGGNPQKHEHDVVLVHGLHSGPISDWQEVTGPLWPVELLGPDLPNTRIMSFGYHTNKPIVRGNDGLGEGTVFNHGEALCSDLFDEREKLPDNPSITFIGHGAGGIVIKSALCYSHARGSVYGSILQKTKHVIFLDTPHFGLNSDAWRVISRGTFSEKSKGQWDLWSRVLSELRSTFSGISASFNITSACASLTESCDEAVPGTSGLTCLPNERVIHLHGVRHLTISRFEARDNNYQTLLRRIQFGRIYLTKDPEQIQKLRDWLGVNEAWNTDDRNDALRERYENTCEWLLRDEIFQGWVDKRPGSNPILWLTAPGGTGKSVLCAFASDQISEMQPGAATPYLMLTYKKNRTKCQMASLLASQLLDHVLHKEKGLDTNVLSLLSRNASHAETVLDLVGLLVDQCSSVYFFLDGLDEVDLSDADSSQHGRSNDQKRFRDDLAFIVDYLSKLAQKNLPTEVRLWCSSQSTRMVCDWMKKAKARELAVNRKLVKQDVQKYLDSIDLERLSDPQDQLHATDVLRVQAGWNFRWAVMMRDSLKECKTPKLLMDKVHQGLPRDLSTIYASRLDELKARDKVEQEDGTGPPLSTNILSILGCARRPLKIREVQEALSIIETTIREDGSYESLAPDITIECEDIKSRCIPLVDFKQTSADPDDGYLHLSHASVWRFLHGRDGKESSDEPEKRVNQEIIAEACLRYLLQSRYAAILTKKSCDEFETAAVSGNTTENVRQHHFLQYAAKYWYRHVEQVGPGWYGRTSAFMRAPQFLTAIQVQSLFVVGHFINTFNRENERRWLMKQNLPDWLKDREEGVQLIKGYEIFLAEWSKFLQIGLSQVMNGEIDKCFWGALGATNFLHAHGSKIESNNSFLLVGGDSSNRSGCVYETISNDGKRMSVWSMASRLSEEADQSSRQVTLVRELWHIDGNEPPKQYGPPETFSFHPASVAWDQYDPCRRRAYPLVPTAETVMHPAPVADSQHGLFVRIGAVAFSKEKRGLWVPSNSEHSHKASRLYWEDILVRGPYMAYSRRAFLSQENDDGDGNIESPKVNNPRSSKPRQRAAKCAEDDADKDDFDHLDSETSHLRDVLSSAEEYWTMDSSEFDVLESDDAQESGSEQSGSPSDDARDSDQESDVESHSSKTCSSKSSASAKSKAAVPSSSVHDDESSADGLADDDGDADQSGSGSGDDSDADSERLLQQPGIGRSQNLSCDHCRDPVARSGFERKVIATVFYQCRFCTPGNSYDVCSKCFKKGLWCKDNSHQLRKLTLRKDQLVTLGVLSRDDARQGVHIVVEKQARRGGRDAVFRYSSDKSSPLHASPPAFHPTLPLLVYPMSGTRILFANISEQTYFTYRVAFDDAEKQGENGCSALSVALRFSCCGRFLYVARVTGMCPLRLTKDATKTRLVLQVITLQLSARNPCSGMPRAHTRRLGISLGLQPCGAVQRLPYQLTWTDDYVYVSTVSTQTGSCFLIVFRVPLSHEGNQGSKVENADAAMPVGEIQKLEKLVPLPRSARVRPVYFFPAGAAAVGGRAESRARIVLGSLHGERSEPPTVVYLRRENVGDWVAAKDAMTTLSKDAPFARRDSLLERFDADSDCDLIIPLHDFQR